MDELHIAIFTTLCNPVTLCLPAPTHEKCIVGGRNCFIIKINYGAV